MQSAANAVHGLTGAGKEEGLQRIELPITDA